jgi:hypothetical protein
MKNIQQHYHKTHLNAYTHTELSYNYDISVIDDEVYLQQKEQSSVKPIILN